MSHGDNVLHVESGPKALDLNEVALALAVGIVGGCTGRSLFSLSV